MSNQTQTEMGKTKPEPVALLNAISTSMMPKGGIVVITPLTMEQAKATLQYYGFVSYIGHPATAQLLTTLLGINIPANRGQFIATTETIAIVVSILERLPEGKILGFEELMQLYKAGKIQFYRVFFQPSH